MLMRKISAFSLAVFAAACTTAPVSSELQSNTQYKVDTPASQGVAVKAASTEKQVMDGANLPAQSETVAPASYTRVSQTCLSGEKQRQIIGMTASGDPVFSIEGPGEPCMPEAETDTRLRPVVSPAFADGGGAMAQSSPNGTAENSEAPTDRAYAEDTIGTPGYHAVMGTQPADPAASPNPSENAARQTPKEFKYKMPAAPKTNTIKPAASSASNGYTWHEVVENDTVYSLSRSVCAEVEDVQTLNSLDEDFAIKLGQSIKLPASQCE